MRKKGVVGENQVLAALALLEEAISDQRQAKLEENQDSDLINEASLLGINEANKLRMLYRALYEIPETVRGYNV